MRFKTYTLEIRALDKSSAMNGTKGGPPNHSGARQDSMLKIASTRSREQFVEVYRETELVSRISELLGGREARVFPPDALVKAWQIFLRHSTITTEAHGTFADAARDLIGKLENEEK